MLALTVYVNYGTVFSSPIVFADWLNGQWTRQKYIVNEPSTDDSDYKLHLLTEPLMILSNKECQTVLILYLHLKYSILHENMMIP